MSTIKIDAERVLCSVCGNKTRDKIGEDTILRIVAVQSSMTLPEYQYYKSRLSYYGIRLLFYAIMNRYYID